MRIPNTSVRTYRFQFVVSLLAIMLVSTPMAAAQSVNSNVGTSSFSFLKINSGARPVSMGGAFTGLADDESALFYNPAGLATLEGKHWLAGYHNYFVDLQSGSLGYFSEIRYGTVAGVYASYMDFGEFIETNEDGDELGTFGGGDLLLGVSLATTHRDQYRLGANLKFLYERLEDYSATGLALDIGGRWSTLHERYSVGLAVQNLGFQISALGETKDKLPLTVRAGGAARLRGLPFRFAGDVIVPIDNDIQIALGGEYLDLQPMYIRIGWNSFGSNYRTADSDDSWAGLSMGAGFDINRMHIAYALTLGAELGESHRITWTGEL